MGTDLQNYILAVITKDFAKVGGSGPIFLAADDKEQQKISLHLARVLGGVVHDLENGVYVVVKH